MTRSQSSLICPGGNFSHGCFSDDNIFDVQVGSIRLNWSSQNLFSQRNTHEANSCRHYQTPRGFDFLPTHKN